VCRQLEGLAGNLLDCFGGFFVFPTSIFLVCVVEDEPELVCRRCDKVFHMQCLRTPLEMLPLNEWECELCVMRQPSVTLAAAGSCAMCASTVPESSAMVRV
jgi:hypothetical protein